MARINFVSVKCERQQDVTGLDELEILIDGSLFLGPMAINKNETLPLTPKFWDFDGSITLTLREHNSPTSHKVIGTRTVTAGNPDPQPVDFKTSGAHYELTYTLT